MGFLDNSYDNPDEDEKRREREAAAISMLSAVAKEARGEGPAQPPIDVDYRQDPQMRADSAFNAERARLADQVPRGPVAHTIDPGKQMSPEAFATAADPKWDEKKFRQWFDPTVKKLELSPNPDDKEAFYNYRGFYNAMQKGEVKSPDQPGGHWDSRFKDPEHPRAYLQDPETNRYFDTMTGRYTGGDHALVPGDRMERLNNLDLGDLTREQWNAARKGADGPSGIAPASSSARPPPDAAPLAAAAEVVKDQVPPARDEPMALKPLDSALRGLTGREPPGRAAPVAASVQVEAAPTESAKPAAEGRPELSPWAVVADLLANHGNGLKDIAQTLSAQQGQYDAKQVAAARASVEDAFKRAQIRHLDAQGRAAGAGNDWKADESARGWEGIRQREADIDYRKGGLGIRQQQWDAKQDPNSAQNTTTVMLAEQKAAAGVKGRENEKHDLIDQSAGDQRELTTARTDASLDEKHAHASEVAADAAARGSALETARNTARSESPQVLAQQADQFAKETDKDIQTARLIDKLDSITGKYREGELPGVGMVEGRVPNAVRALAAAAGGDRAKQEQTDALDVQNARSQMADLRQRALSGAAGPVTEKSMYELQTGSAPGATEAEFKAGLRAMRDVTRGALAVHSAGKETAAARVLESGGLGHWGTAPALPTTRGPVPKVDAVISQTPDDEDPYAKWLVR